MQGIFQKTPSVHNALLIFVGICLVILTNCLHCLRDCCRLVNKVLGDESINWPHVRRRNYPSNHLATYGTGKIFSLSTKLEED